MMELKKLYEECEKGIHGEMYSVSMKSDFYIKNHEQLRFIKVPISINDTTSDDYLICCKPFDLAGATDRFWEITANESNTTPVYTEEDIIKYKLEKSELKINHLKEGIEYLRAEITRLNKRRFKWRWLY